MTKPDAAAVATLAGRELDAAVSVALFGEEPRDWFTVLPYSTEEGPAFFAMIAAVRAKGWLVEIRDCREVWAVNLIYPIKGGCFREVELEASTLPLAFARAALLTTYPPEATP